MRNEVVISCVGENQQEHFINIYNLAKSIRALAGTLSTARLIFYFVEDIKEEYLLSLRKLGVEVRVVNRFHQDCPHANKFRMMELAEPFDYLVALDVDTAVLRDFSEHLKPEGIGMCHPQNTPFSLEKWAELFTYFNIPFPRERYRTVCSDKINIPYFNSGVMIIPRKLLKPLREKWTGILLNYLADAGILKKRKLFKNLDQIALALTLQAADLPYYIMPLEMNFPSGAPILPRYNPEMTNPYIIHYKRALTPEGLIKGGRFNRARAAIQQLNQILLQDQTAGSA